MVIRRLWRRPDRNHPALAACTCTPAMLTGLRRPPALNWAATSISRPDPPPALQWPNGVRSDPVFVDLSFSIAQTTRIHLREARFFPLKG